MKKTTLYAVVLVVVLALSAGVLLWMKQQESQTAIVPEQQDEDTQNNQNIPRFVTDVDPNVDHWQTKETEYMVFKFPKEWYWVELPVEKSGANGAHVISNNPEFPIENYRNDSINMTGVGSYKTLNNTEVVITDWGTPTSNAGTPLDSIDSQFYLAKQIDPSAECVASQNTKILPLVATCVFGKEDHQMEYKYYIIDATWTLIITARTTDDTIVSKDILEQIARNIKIKY